jgi:hypothetical protein
MIYVFCAIWGLVYACILTSLNATMFTSWQYWVGIILPIVGIFMFSGNN